MESRPAKPKGPIRFGEGFELDVRFYKLRRSAQLLKLERIPMEVLILLVEHHGEIVSREELAAKIWGKDVFLDTDNSLNGAIRKIRSVLRDDPEQPRYIQTITGSGYRFIAPFSEQAPTAAEPDLKQEQTQNPIAPLETRDASSSLLAGTRTVETPKVSPVKARRRVQNAFVFTGLSLLLVVGLAAWFARSGSRAHQPTVGRVMLAVLPFQNLTGDPAQEYFSDGLTEEMIMQVGNLDQQRLGVIARTSIMHYKNTQAALNQIGRELGVQYVIEGSVRRDANNIRITAQLVRTKDQTRVWSRQYDRELKGFLSLQGEIAREVADEIQLTLGDGKPAVAGKSMVPAKNYEAYDLFLKGQYFLNKRTAADLTESIRYFQQAASKDPNYARTYASLASAYALMGGYSGQPQTQFIPKARAAALRALQIDERLAEAHTALALIVQSYDWDWSTAEREFQRAIALNPNYATAHHWYAEHLMWRGRFEEALLESEQARQLDPLSLIIAADNGAILYFSGQYDRAIEKWRSVIEMDPHFIRAHLIKAAYVQKGMFKEALAYSQSEIPASEWSWLTYINGRSGQTAKAKLALQHLLRMNANQPVDPMLIAWAYAGLYDEDQALIWLEKAYAVHSSELVTLKVNPSFDFMRGDPHFQDLLRRVGLAK